MYFADCILKVRHFTPRCSGSNERQHEAAGKDVAL